MWRATRLARACVLLAIVSCFSLMAQPPKSLVLPGQSLTLLTGGRILMAGGDDHGKATDAAYLIDVNGDATKLPSVMISPREGHTATALPDGTVLIFGGTDGHGHYVRSMEIFDPRSLQFTQWSGFPLVPRAGHTATLLTDGRVVIIGGTEEGGAFPTDIQTWDFRTGVVRSTDVAPLYPRQGHTAKLLENGEIFISGGYDGAGKAIKWNEVFNPSITEFQIFQGDPPADTPGALQLAESIPVDGANQFPIADFIKLRFTELTDVTSITSQSIHLLAKDGTNVTAEVTIGEEGRLAFLIPSIALLPGVQYTLSIKGVKDLSGNTLSTTIQFQTEGIADTGAADGWTPDSDALAGNWNSKTGQSPWEKLPSLKAPAGVTALAGQVLGLSGNPVSRVTLQIEGKQVQSDNSGRFLLGGVAPGRQILVIDGMTANKPSAQYGQYELAVDLKAGVTTALNYTIWMTKLDTAHVVHIASPTTETDTIVKTPLLPGLELHLPAGTTIVSRDGKPITDLTITPIPLDKPPFPLPTGVRVPIYFTIQPGLSEIRTPGSGPTAKGAQLYYPNSFDEPAGMNYNFWNYDASSKGWYIYGNGSVNQQRTQIVPDPGVYVYELTGAMVGSSGPKPPRRGRGPRRGDPVALVSGEFVYSRTDLVLPDTAPISLTRTYITNDHYQRPFGIGTTDNYDMFMVGNTFPYTYQELILPDGTPIRFNRTSSGTGYTDAVYASTSTSGPWYGATLYWNPTPTTLIPGSVWILKARDGTLYGFPDGSYQNSQTKQALVGIQDRNGNLIAMTRDSNANLTKITSPNGRSISLTYDAQNRITSATDNSARTVSYTYDSAGHLATVTDANGGVTSFAYNSNDLMTSITDPRNIAYIANQYDSYGRITQQTQADGSTYLFSWTPSSNSAENWVSTTPPVNRYDPTAYEGYTGLISEVQITDPRGYVEVVDFDNLGRTIDETKALGQPEVQSSSMQYYADGLEKSATDPMGRQTTFDYDSSGNLTTVTRLAGTPNAVTSTMTYDSVYANLLTVTDPLSHTTTFTYDSLGNLLQTSDPLGNGVTLAYSAGGGKVSSITDAVGNTTNFSYTGGDLTGTTDPIGNTTAMFVDNAGRVTSITDPKGGVTGYQYDNLNELTGITNAQGHQALFGYDPNGNLLSRQDYSGNVTQYTYDSMDRPITQTNPLLRGSSVTYDFGGNAVSNTDRDSQTTSRTFDGLGREVFVGYGTTTSGGTTTYQSTVTYAFDAGNRLTSATDSLAGTITRTYDGLDDLLSETTPGGSVAYTYDAAQRRITAQPSTSASASYGYDNANRLTSITQGTTNVGFVYDTANRRTSLSLANGVTVTYGYDQDSHLQTIAYSSSAGSLGNLSYVYDASGHRTEVDGSLAHTNLPFALGSATYDAANELTAWDGGVYSYDSNGNTTADPSGNLYTWDARGQLAGITGPASASFSYDPFGRRLGKTISGQTTSFLYDGVNRVAETSTAGTATLLPGGVDEYFMRTDSSGTTSPIGDAIGSTIATTDGGGNLIASYWYDPYGGTTVTGTPTADATQFTGRENDGTGLYFYRARYFNPATGHFLNEDPSGASGGLNLYAYAGDDPLDFNDPFGLKPKPNDPQPCPKDPAGPNKQDNSPGKSPSKPPCKPAPPQPPSQTSQPPQPPPDPLDACWQQAQQAMDAQPESTPGPQDLLDALYGAVAGFALDGFGSALKGAGVGLAAQSVGHTFQKGAAYQWTFNGCVTSQGHPEFAVVPF